MVTVLLGNVAPKADEVDGKAVTTFHVPDGVAAVEAAQTVGDAYTAEHSTDPPEWVQSDDRLVAELLADRFKCEVVVESTTATKELTS